SGSWTGTFSMHVARGYHAAVLLANGEVLVAGGVSPGGYLASTELYDPVTDRWTDMGAMAAARGYVTATALGNGTVLEAGGSNSTAVQSIAELFDPAPKVGVPGIAKTTPKAAAVGKKLTLSGHDLAGVTAAWCGGVPATVTGLSDGGFTLTVPNGAST